MDRICKYSQGVDNAPYFEQKFFVNPYHILWGVLRLLLFCAAEASEKNSSERKKSLLSQGSPASNGSPSASLNTEAAELLQEVIRYREVQSIPLSD